MSGLQEAGKSKKCGYDLSWNVLEKAILVAIGPGFRTSRSFFVWLSAAE